MQNSRASHEAPQAFATVQGNIIGYNEPFATLCGNRNLDSRGVSLTALAKFNTTTGLLESAYNLDQINADGKGVWRATLDSKISDDFEIVAKTTTMKINGKACLEVTIQEVPATRSVRPVSMRTAAEEKTDDINMHAAFREAAFTTHRVLIVDDSSASLKVMERLVSSLGHEVRTAINGIDALEKLRCNTFDVVLMDINMPLMNGLEASYEFRRIEKERNSHDGGRPHQKIVAMSSDIGVSLFYECTNAGFDAFVPKPLTKERFHEVLRFLAQQHNKGLV